jgi:hypothetical protein
LRTIRAPVGWSVYVIQSPVSVNWKSILALARKCQILSDQTRIDDYSNSSQCHINFFSIDLDVHFQVCEKRNESICTIHRTPFKICHALHSSSNHFKPLEHSYGAGVTLYVQHIHTCSQYDTAASYCKLQIPNEQLAPERHHLPIIVGHDQRHSMTE